MSDDDKYEWSSYTGDDGKLVLVPPRKLRASETWEVTCDVCGKTENQYRKPEQHETVFICYECCGPLHCMGNPRGFGFLTSKQRFEVEWGDDGIHWKDMQFRVALDHMQRRNFFHQVRVAEIALGLLKREIKIGKESS